jgi:molybdate transport system substrate-binding protein
MKQEIRLFGAIAVRPAVLALIPQFEMATGLTVAARWEVNPTVKKQIEAGEPFDLVIINPDMVEALTASGKVEAGSQTAFGRIGMGVAAKAGSRPLAIGSTEAFKQALKSARSIAYASDGTSGGYFSSLLDRLGIADEVKPRLVAAPGGQTASAVGRGEAELAVVPVTSILAAAPDVMLVGRFPAELQSTSTLTWASAPIPATRKPRGSFRNFWYRQPRMRSWRPRASSDATSLFDRGA